MYIIYYQTVNDKEIQVKDFAYTFEEATDKMTQIAKDLIVLKEGIEKSENAFKDQPVDLTKLQDGMYLVRSDNSINVYKKTTSLKEIAGWLGITKEFESKNEYLGYFVMKEFESKLLDFHKRSAFEGRPIPTKNAFKPNNVIDELIHTMSENGFKPKKDTRFVIKKNTVSPTIMALDLSVSDL